MGEKELVLELSDLAQISFCCKHAESGTNTKCGTTLAFPAGGAARAVEIVCPGCGHNYSQIRGVLSAFGEFLKAAGAIKDLDTRITVHASALGGPAKP